MANPIRIGSRALSPGARRDLGASAKRPRRFTEQVAGGRPDAVDRERGVVKGVKVLGPSSLNNRRYTSAAITQAAGLYEGAAVFADHPSRPGDARSVHDKIGWLSNIKAGGDGLRGDLNLLNPKSDLAERVFNAAERNPAAFGLSHNCMGEGNDDANGVFVIERITEIRSVDLVCEPATNATLFESVQPPKGKSMPAALTRRAFVEHLTGRKLREADTEGDGMNDLPDVLGGDDTPSAASSEWRDAAARLVGKLVASEDPEAHDLARMLTAALKANDAGAATESLIRQARRLVNARAIFEDRRRSAARRQEARQSIANGQDLARFLRR